MHFYSTKEKEIEFCDGVKIPFENWISSKVLCSLTKKINLCVLAGYLEFIPFFTYS